MCNLTKLFFSDWIIIQWEWFELELNICYYHNNRNTYFLLRKYYVKSICETNTALYWSHNGRQWNIKESDYIVIVVGRDKYSFIIFCKKSQNYNKVGDNFLLNCDVCWRCSSQHQRHGEMLAQNRFTRWDQTPETLPILICLPS